MLRRHRKNTRAKKRNREIESVPKVCGADIELGNFIVGTASTTPTSWQASRALLREIHGVPHSNWSWADSIATSVNTADSTGYSTVGIGLAGEDDNLGILSSVQVNSKWSYNPQDVGRKFLSSNGGSVYIDLQHLELCLPEVRSAYDYVAAWHAMLLIAREALDRANAKLPAGQTIEVLVNNTDNCGKSYGSHTNFLTTRRCWTNLFHRKLHHMLYLASYFTSSIVFTGAGKVGSDNGKPPVNYQISARADFYEKLMSEMTTSHRPIVNTRDESLCGSSLSLHSLEDEFARVHIIFFDNTLCHISNFLKIGVTQIILAMIEQECVTTELILEDPLNALARWSHNPELNVRAKIASGAVYTAVELQMALLERAQRFVDAGKTDHIVPQADEILETWSQTLDELNRWEVDSLAGKLDWVLKYCILTHAIEQNGFSWDSPEIKHLDFQFSNLDSNKGLYWIYERNELVKRLTAGSQIEFFVHEPPKDTRAWLRTHILRNVDPDSIDGVDWDFIRFKLHDEFSSSWFPYSYYTLPMSNPLSGTHDQCQGIFERANSFEDALKALGLQESQTSYSGNSYGNRIS